ncbi:MAG: phytase [Roseiflexaceae bacterium]|nr:phytase [Roseiflexaceae bacterium]
MFARMPMMAVVLVALLAGTVAAAPSAPPRATAPGQAPIAAPVRFASFNASLNRNATGQLVTDLSTPDNQQAKNAAETIQRVNPDVVLINEFDYDAQGQALRLFQQNYLAVAQNDALAVTYPYSYTAESNTGIASGFDLNNNGAVVTTPGAAGYGDDAYGFGVFPGQFGMAIYSKYPIDTAKIRTFQKFLWKDLPGALLPDDPATAGVAADWYSAEELAVFRLSSKSHWDVPIDVNGTMIHALVSHPTPPTFDGPEDRNGRRNHDEIRLWADYVSPGRAAYLYDDKGATGGLTAGANFVIMGDQNADPEDGDSVDSAILQILNLPNVNTSITPASPGGPQQAAAQGGANAVHKGDPAFDTADFADGAPGNLRVDYVLPSTSLRMIDAEVFWPLNTDPLFRLVGVFTPPTGFPTSDHRLVWADVQAVTTVTAKVETPPVVDADVRPGGEPNGDADDPAIYVHPTDPSRSFVIGVLKNGGLQVYDLAGAVLQTIAPADIRYNNIDLQYGFTLGAEQIDIAVATDRRNDKLVFFRIDPASRQLTDITDPALGRLFSAGNDQVLVDQQTAYGIALYRSAKSGKTFVFVSQRSADTVAQFELVAGAAGKLSATPVRSFKLRIPAGGELEDAQIEGMVADHLLGTLYIAQEKAGIWKVGAEPDVTAAPSQIDQVYPNGGNLKADAEGLVIYYLPGGKGYLLASSQGDSTFAVYTREGANAYLGSFRVGDGTAADGVQNSDGADIVNVGLGSAYPNGLLVVHDGSNDPAVLVEDDGELENASTNFKFVDWRDVAQGFLPGALQVNTVGYAPRAPNSSRAFLPVVGQPAAGR